MANRSPSKIEIPSYRAARQKAAFFDSSYRTVLKFHGADTVSFLQRMVSNDVTLLAAGKGCYTAILEKKGKILGEFRLHHLGEEFLAESDGTGAEKIKSHLEKYVVADEVEIQDQSDLFAVYSVIGPKAGETAPGEIGDLGLYQNRKVQLNGKEAIAVRTDALGLPQIDFFLSKKEIAKIRNLFPSDELDSKTAEILRIENGIPRYGAELDETCMPPEAGLDEEIISYTKGCYLGQEVIARIKSRGHVNRRLVGIKFSGDSPPPAGTPLILDGKEVGKITSVALSPDFGLIGLAVIHKKAAEAGNKLTVQDSSAEPVPLPFR